MSQTVVLPFPIRCPTTKYPFVSRIPIISRNSRVAIRLSFGHSMLWRAARRPRRSRAGPRRAGRRGVRLIHVLAVAARFSARAPSPASRSAPVDLGPDHGARLTPGARFRRCRGRVGHGSGQHLPNRTALRVHQRSPLLRGESNRRLGQLRTVVDCIDIHFHHGPSCEGARSVWTARHRRSP
jgi:hypothetical protein